MRYDNIRYHNIPAPSFLFWKFVPWDRWEIVMLIVIAYVKCHRVQYAIIAVSFLFNAYGLR